jgi:hypothetical protein
LMQSLQNLYFEYDERDKKFQLFKYDETDKKFELLYVGTDNTSPKAKKTIDAILGRILGSVNSNNLSNLADNSFLGILKASGKEVSFQNLFGPYSNSVLLSSIIDASTTISDTIIPKALPIELKAFSTVTQNAIKTYLNNTNIKSAISTKQAPNEQKIAANCVPKKNRMLLASQEISEDEHFENTYRISLNKAKEIFESHLGKEYLNKLTEDDYNKLRNQYLDNIKLSKDDGYFGESIANLAAKTLAEGIKKEAKQKDVESSGVSTYASIKNLASRVYNKLPSLGSIFYGNQKEERKFLTDEESFDWKEVNHDEFDGETFHDAKDSQDDLDQALTKAESASSLNQSNVGVTDNIMEAVQRRDKGTFDSNDQSKGDNLDPLGELLEADNGTQEAKHTGYVKMRLDRHKGQSKSYQSSDENEKGEQEWTKTASQNRGGIVQTSLKRNQGNVEKKDVNRDFLTAFGK